MCPHHVLDLYFRRIFIYILDDRLGTTRSNRKLILKARATSETVGNLTCFTLRGLPFKFSRLTNPQSKVIYYLLFFRVVSDLTAIFEMFFFQLYVNNFWKDFILIGPLPLRSQYRENGIFVCKNLVLVGCLVG